MLSVSNVSGGAAASGYYKTEGYYKEGSPEAEAAAQWHGKAAEALAMAGRQEFQGSVDDKVFTDVLDGRAPSLERDEKGNWKDDKELGRWVDGERQHRPGIDLTFSAAKSVSVMALVAKDDRIVAAHDAAVKAAVTYVEENMVSTRRQNSAGEMEVVEGGKIIAGLFRHDTSRSLDPQLHTHAVIANMVLNPDGKWSSLRNDDIFKGKMLAGEIYRSELAANLRDLGYTVERRGKDAIPEIVGVSSKLLDTFSKRSAAIDAALERRGLEDTPENRALAALATREAKSGNLNRDQLQREWSVEAARAGQSIHELGMLKDQATFRKTMELPGVTRVDGIVPHAERQASEALSFAVAHLSERQSVYSKDDILRTVLQRVDRVRLDHVEQAIKVARDSGTLLDAGRDGRKQIFTDKETLATEREVVREYRLGRNDTKIELPRKYDDGQRHGDSVLKKELSRTTLTEGQREAVMTALTGTSRFVGVQGYAGTGKTFMVETLNKYAERTGYQLDGLAPSGRAVEALKEAIPTATTLQSWLVQIRAGGTPGAEDKSKRILVVDEAGMIPSRDMLDLTRFANAQGYARVVLVGDVKQLDAVEAGQPFQQLQRAGMPTAIMADIQRQRTEAGREAVLHAIKGEIKEAMDKIGRVSELQGGENLPAGVASRWLGLMQHDRDRTGIVVLTNAVRKEINDQIRDGLKAEMRVGSEDVELKGLRPLSLTRAAAADARSYDRGNIIVADETLKKEGLERGVFYTVIATDIRKNTITVTGPGDEDARTISLRQDGRAAAHMRSYEAVTAEFSVRERVRFTLSDKDHGLINGVRGTIDKIDNDQVTVKLNDGRKLDLPTSSLAARGMDHAYASTAHDFQGSTVDRIIIGMSSTEQMSNQKSFYVDISRVREEATLITNDVAGLTKRIEQNTGDRPTALDSWLAAQRDERERQIKVQQTAKDSGDKAQDQAQAQPRELDEARKAALTKEERDAFTSIRPERTDAERDRTVQDIADRQKQKVMEGPQR